jgi:predicted short-subunit dehydrogenase-like oxidoreductase (DUF2520 family)
VTSTNSAAPRLTVGVVGTGRAGSVLAAALGGAGHHIVAAYGVSELSRLRAEALLPGVPLVSPEEVFTAAELVLVTVPDDVLPDLIGGLAATDAIRPGQLIAHASGRYGIGVLAPASALGALPLALHPAMTLTGTSLDLQRLSGAPFGVTTSEGLRPVAEALVVEMGGEPVWVPEQSRALYHAALANGANHLITLVTQSLDLLTAAGVEHPQRLLSPLLYASLDNALRNGDAALTGPVVRGDAGTVAAHVDVINDVSEQARRAYVGMARLTADRALAAGRLAPQQAEALLSALASRDSGDEDPG